jgi:long-chain acyl-CoA synthetase
MPDEIATLHDVIATLDRPAQQPAILAMQTEGMDEWTFARLADHSRRLAAGLRQSGLEPGARAALVAPNRPEWIVACLALIKAGGVPVLSVPVRDFCAHHLGTSSPRGDNKPGRNTKNRAGIRTIEMESTRTRSSLKAI